MIGTTLTKPKYVDKTVAFKNFKDITEEAYNVIVGDKVRCSRFGTFYDDNLPAKASKLYKEGDKVFLYGYDKYLYYKTLYMFNKTISCTSAPLIKDVIFNGQKDTIIIAPNIAYLLNSQISGFTMPYGSSIEVYSNRLFVAKEKDVYFSGEFDFVNNSMDLNNAGFFSVENDAIEILKIFKYDDYLLIICSNAIYKFTINSNGEFNLKRYNLPLLNIQKNTIEKIANQVFFVSNKQLCVFKDGSIEIKTSIYDKLLIDAYFTNSGISGSKYMLEINIGKRYLFIHDVVEDVDFIFGNYSYTFSNGLFFDNSNMQLLVPSDMEITRGYWQSKSMDFSTSKNKFLTEISLYMNQEGEVVIIGDFGEKILFLEKGKNDIKLNLMSKVFSFNFKSYSMNFIAKNFRIKYRLMGE